MNKMQRSFLGSLGKKVNQATQERAVVLQQEIVQKPAPAPKKIEEAEINLVMIGLPKDSKLE